MWPPGFWFCETWVFNAFDHKQEALLEHLKEEGPTGKSRRLRNVRGGKRNKSGEEPVLLLKITHTKGGFRKEAVK